MRCKVAKTPHERRDFKRSHQNRNFVDVFQQEALIAQLQEQHYQQYMAQVYAQQAAMQQQQQAAAKGENAQQAGDVPPVVPKPGDISTIAKPDETRRDDDSDVSDEEPGDDLPCEF